MWTVYKSVLTNWFNQQFSLKVVNTIVYYLVTHLPTMVYLYIFQYTSDTLSSSLVLKIL
jgi:hypothetical protein